MSDPNVITTALFSDFLKCRTKAFYLSNRECADSLYFSGISDRIAILYREAATYKSRGFNLYDSIDFAISDQSKLGDFHINFIDCASSSYKDTTNVNVHHDNQISNNVSEKFCPILFIPWDKVDAESHNILCFGAISLEQKTGVLPDSGFIIFGSNFHKKTVKIHDYISGTRKLIFELCELKNRHEPPPLVLGKQCSICDYQIHCRNLAIEQDNLSLLTSLTDKERIKYYEKGVKTISQLSYGYRPKRCKRNRPDTERAVKRNTAIVKNDHKLRALAIKKGQTHVVNTNSVCIEGSKVFIDVEGMPDRGFYYLIGITYISGSAQIEKSFWADHLLDEESIWHQCLRELRTIDNPQLLSYGAYENRFLLHMKERYAKSQIDIEYIDTLLKNSINILGLLYGRIYFPTYSNSLKDIARFLGFIWTWGSASGAATTYLRRVWELCPCEDIRKQLVIYNLEDCRAACLVAETLIHISSGSDQNLVKTGSLEAKFQRTFGKFDSILPEFEKINNAAYWDYQRSKVFIRTDKTIKKVMARIEVAKKNIIVDARINVCNPPIVCAKCGGEKFWKINRHLSKVIYDIKPSKRGFKRQVTQYIYINYRCSDCKTEVTGNPTSGSRYGNGIISFIIYLQIELLLSFQKSAVHASLLFNFPVSKANVTLMKSEMAAKYAGTHKLILSNIAEGKLVHADETKGVVKGGGHYIWVLTNMTNVAYVYSESRESTTIETLLEGFNGVLVSDFYAAYDGIPCAQQKCLIHLMRDINEDMHKNPFDEELKEIGCRFGHVLREIVETIDKHGLATHYLAKHKSSALSFIDHIIGKTCSTETSRSLCKRIEKNHNKLFTFLDYDGIPWNNNNAEHAVKAFTRLRNVMITSTPRGTQDYTVLLSIQQTLRYRGKSFLEFLNSGKLSID